MSKEAERLAKELGGELNTLHDPTVSEDPFSWTDTDDERRRRSEVLGRVMTRLSTFRYIPKTGTILKIVGFGTILPLAVLGILFLAGIPQNEDLQLMVWGGLGAVAVVFAIVAMVVAGNPSLDQDLALALATVARDWSFSRINGRKAWRAYKSRFGFFNQGDEDQSIYCRAWGHLDDERKRAFQMFHFYFETVYYTTEYIRDSKGNIIGSYQVKHEDPHHRYGMFAQMPESKTRFRVTETGGNPGFDTEVKLEYAALNRAANVYCDASDELVVRKFLSPAVQEAVMAFSEWLPGLVLDFHPGLVLVIMDHDPFGELRSLEFDEHATKFRELLKPGADHVAHISSGIAEKLCQIAKYND